MSFPRYTDYETIVQFLTKARAFGVNCERAQTEKAIARACGMTVYRVRPICEWLTEHEIATYRTLCHRIDPHDGDRMLPIRAFSLKEHITIERLRKRMHDCALARMRREEKTFDFSALNTAWR